MTPNREDYIKIIFAMNEKNSKLTNKELAETLEISQASASEMVRKLIDSERVTKDKVLGLKLTEKGIKEAQDLVRKHRLWEVFLVEHLNYTWTEVHEDAEVLEHVTSTVLADRLSEFLGNPKYCPHGSIIYGNQASQKNLNNLASLSVGDRATFIRVRDDQELLKYIETLNLQLNDSFELVKIDPYEGPYHINVDGKDIAISYKAAHDMDVRKEH